MLQRLAIALAATLSFAGAAEAAGIQSLWKAAEGTPGKQFLAVVQGGDLYNAEDYLLVFGEKDGRVTSRDFVTNIGFSDYDGADGRARDDFYTLTWKVVKKSERMKVTLDGATAGYHYDLDYRISTDAAARKQAEAIIADLTKRWAKLSSGEPKTVVEFRDLLKLLARSWGYSGAEDSLYAGDAFPLPVYDLQIEASFWGTPPNAEFAKAKIKADGSDVISRKFRDGKTWLTTEEMIPDAEDREDDEVFSVWTVAGDENAYFLEPFESAVAKFARYQIVNESFFECEDSYYTWRSVTLVLKDGSTFSYSPGTECD
jgi:hypothetical protein